MLCRSHRLRPLRVKDGDSPTAGIWYNTAMGFADQGFYSVTDEGVVLNVRAQPRSSRAGLDGLLGDAVKVRIRCAPVDGKANKELIETLADAFSLPKSQVVFKSGETSKTKRILLRGKTAAEIEAVLGGLK